MQHVALMELQQRLYKAAHPSWPCGSGGEDPSDCFDKVRKAMIKYHINLRKIGKWFANTKNPVPLDKRIKMKQKALVIVDMQNDFVLKTGSLSVPDAETVVEVINNIRQAGIFDLIVLTQDYHPPNHMSFVENNLERGAVAFQSLNLSTGLQMMWPTHCVQGTFGTDFVAGLIKLDSDFVVQKGADPFIDSYSGFYDNNHLKKTELDSLLKDYGLVLFLS